MNTCRQALRAILYNRDRGNTPIAGRSRTQTFDSDPPGWLREGASPTELPSMVMLPVLVSRRQTTHAHVAEPPGGNRDRRRPGRWEVARP
jgi:hypothetical protein